MLWVQSGFLKALRVFYMLPKYTCLWCLQIVQYTEGCKVEKCVSFLWLYSHIPGKYSYLCFCSLSEMLSFILYTSFLLYICLLLSSVILNVWFYNLIFFNLIIFPYYTSSSNSLSLWSSKISLYGCPFWRMFVYRVFLLKNIVKMRMSLYIYEGLSWICLTLSSIK